MTNNVRVPEIQELTHLLVGQTQLTVKKLVQISKHSRWAAPKVLPNIKKHNNPQVNLQKVKSVADMIVDLKCKLLAAFKNSHFFQK